MQLLSSSQLLLRLLTVNVPDGDLFLEMENNVGTLGHLFIHLQLAQFALAMFFTL